MEKKFGSYFWCSIFLLCGYFSKAADNSRSDTLDIVNYQINLDITDFAGSTIKGNCLLTVVSKMNTISKIELDLMMLSVDSVKVNNQTATFIYDSTSLIVNLVPVLNAGDTAWVNVFYGGTPQKDSSSYGGGFYFINGYAYNIGVGFAVDPHVFGRAWFPCFDNFVEHSTYDFYITTDTIKKAFCNGLLQNVTDNGNGTRTWYWKMNQAIPTYLASVAVADYGTVNWNYAGINGNIPIILNSAPSDTASMKNSFANLPQAIVAFEQRYGAHRFDRVGYNLVPDVGGAMEHATNIAYLDLLVDGTLNYETMMAHELSHHWWGDLVTCKTAEDMWINEGWATYNEKIFLEYTYGKDAYKQAVRINHEDVLHYTHIDNGGYLPLSPVSHANTYNYGLIYQKGADAAHTLRTYLGDSMFFTCTKSLMADSAFRNISSYDLRDYLSDCSGMDLTSYFENWIFNPGFPHFSIDAINVTDDTMAFTAKGYIRQKLNHAPALYSDVPLEITFFDAFFNKMTKSVIVSGECTEFTASFPETFKPVYAALDFEEKISDAVTDEWQIIKTTGIKDFGTAKMSITVQTITDSALIRVEHNWVAPDRIKNPVPGLYLSNERYWKIAGVIPNGFSAYARITYDGRSPSAPYNRNGYLDNDLLKNNKEDSLVVLYRAYAGDDWTIADSFKVNYGSKTDKTGTINIYQLKLGEYALAIYDASRQDTIQQKVNCIPLGMEKHSLKSSMTLYPNPADKVVRVELNNVDGVVSVSTLDGQIIFQQKISAGTKSIDINTHGWKNGVYFVKVKSMSLPGEIKKLIVVH